MSERISVSGLSGVPETMLVPLYARAVETAREDAICSDPYAVEMVTRIDYDFSRFDADAATALGIAVRTVILDELAGDFLVRHPESVVINIAAGLDTRFLRLDNGKVRWIELDLPEAMDVRLRFIPEQPPRYTSVAASALDPAWPDQVDAQGRPVLVIVEGLLMYFTEDEVRQLLTMLLDRFPGCEMLLEVVGKSQAEKTRSDMVTATSARFRWGIREAARIADWDARLHYVTDISLYDRHQARWLALPLNWPAPLADLRNTVDRIVHLRAGA